MLFDNVSDIDIQKSLEGSYLDYSMSVIVGRALPDARDGLKPVHRRILYAMNKLNITSKTPYKKSARIVGDTIGKYHPHGDTSIYDALVRMAQSFSMRTPLVDGQGNFGSLDGDKAAAMRYTEARMTKFSEDMLQDIDKDTVNFVPTYDDSDMEPSILPTVVPNLLVNGSEGIAVGMATKIPPHNLGEIIDTLLYVIDNKNVQVEDLLKIIQGPDFPTGGTIFGTGGFIDAYTSGRGKVKIRSKHHLETRSKKETIVIDELPYQVNKSRLIEQIANLVREKTLEGISDIRDESDKEGVRIVIEIKREAMSEIVLNNLYKTTSLQTTFGIILLAVYNKEPKIFNLLELLDVFLKHRKTVIIRRTLFDLNKAKSREHILQGLKIAIDNIDEVVKIIRQSSSDSEAKEKLGSTFNLSAIQASAILDMRLGRLTGLQIAKLDTELLELATLIKKLEAILKSETKLNTVIKKELNGIKDKYKTPRRTSIEESYDDIEMEDLIPNEPMVVTITYNGYIKRVSAKSYDRQKRGGKGKIAVTAHSDDFIEKFFISKTHDTLLFVTNKGQLYWLKVYKIPEAGRSAKGKAVVNLIDLKEDEKIMSIIPTTDFDESKSLILFTKKGIAKRTSLNNFSNIRSNGVKAIILNEGDEIVTSAITNELTKYLMVFTSLGQVIKFEVSKIKNQGRSTKGVRAIKFKKPNDRVIDGDIIDGDGQEVLTVASNGIAKRSSVSEYRLTNRGGSGVIAMRLEGNALIIGNVVVDEKNDLMSLTSVGKMIRIQNEAIKKTRRSTKGVKLINIDAKDKVVSIAPCPKEDEEIDLEDTDV